MDKPTFTRICPDCSTPYVVDSSYIDEAYEAHARDEKHCVCQKCFDAFNGMTIDDLFREPPNCTGTHV